MEVHVVKSSLLQVDIADLYAMQLDAVRSDVVEYVLWSLVLMSLWLGLPCWACPGRAERWWNLLRYAPLLEDGTWYVT